jgi:hypothetical protein
MPFDQQALFHRHAGLRHFYRNRHVND